MVKKFYKLLLSVCMLSSVLIPANTKDIHAVDYEEVVTVIDDADIGTSNAFEYEGEWKGASGVGVDYNGTEHWTNKNVWGNTLPSATIHFTGNKIEVFGKKDKDLGIYKVVVDNNEDTAFEVDSYNLTPQNQEKLFEVKDLEEGDHSVKIYIQDKINSMSSATNIGAQLDYAKAYSMQPIDPNKEYKTYINDHTLGDGMFQFSFSSGWDVSSGYPDSFYNGDEHWTSGNGATETFQPSFTMKFYGSKIELFGKIENVGAIYSIRIDDGEEVKVDSYSAKPMTKQLIFSKDGLEEKEHTMYFKVLHERNPANQSSKYSAEIDYAIATHKAIPANNLFIDKETLTIEAGMSDRIKATVMPSYATNSNIVFSVENEDIATIDEHGEIFALQAGSTNVKVQVKGTNIVKIIPLTVSLQGSPLVVSVGDENRLETQDDYSKIVKDKNAAFTSSAWKGDIINSKINLATKGVDIHNATISVSDFTSNQNTIKASNVETYWIKETLANIGRGNPSAPVKAFPEVLHPKKTIDIAKKKVQFGWININVPKDAAPGVYSGSVSIDADELEEPYELAYTFEVIDLLQPTTDDTNTTIQIWQHPFAVANYYGVKKEDYFKEDHLTYMRASMKEYKEMGGRDVVANIVEEAWNNQSYTSDPTMVQWIKKTDGTFTFDYTLFDRWIQFNIDEGVLDLEKGLGQIKCYSIVPWGNQVTYFDEATNKVVKVRPNTGTEDWKSIWTPFLTDFMKHVNEKGWFDLTYIAMDERGMSDLKNAVDLIETVKNKDGKSFKISSAMNYQSANDFCFTDRIHDISIGLSHISTSNTIFKDLVAHRNEKGLVTTVYTCTGDYPSNFTISDAADNAWTMWYSISQGASGYMRWAWDNWVEDPLSNVTYKYWEPGDGWYVYPTEKGQESDTYYYKSPRYELFKQGVRDVNKAKYIKEHSEELRSDVDALLDSLKRPEQGGNGYGSAVAKTKEDRELVLSEVTRMREGIKDISKTYVQSLIVPVTSITLNKTELNLSVGESEQIIATIQPSDATYKDLTWESNNTNIATVSNGTITAISSGQAIISVYNSDRSIKAEVVVNVTGKSILVEKITLDKDEITLKKGEVYKANAEISPSNATNKTLTWSSNDSNIASVEDGNITAVKEGIAIITVYDVTGNASTTLLVHVLAEEKQPAGDNSDKSDKVNTGDITKLGVFVTLIVLSGALCIITRKKKGLK